MSHEKKSLKLVTSIDDQLPELSEKHSRSLVWGSEEMEQIRDQFALNRLARAGALATEQVAQMTIEKLHFEDFPPEAA